MATIEERAARALAGIRANVEAYYADTITFEDFGRNARALWDEIGRDADLSEAVSELMLADLRSARRVA